MKSLVTLRESLWTDHDVFLFREGSHFRLYEKLGAHPMGLEGEAGTYFAVWSPNAEAVSVIGDFNGWRAGEDVLFPRWDASGVWEGFVPGVGVGDLYKFHVKSKFRMYQAEKADPVGFADEVPPRTASKVWDLGYLWGDTEWMLQRKARNGLDAPMSVYEVHLGSWRRVPEEGDRPLSYRELAETLVPYVCEMGFTHVELMPVMEHPFYGSWGYQVTGFFEPTARYGTPQDFMGLVDAFHQHGVGVLLDWVPSHFPGDVHGLVYSDGTHLYEHADRRRGFHPEWQSYIFNYGRNEVREFLISSAFFWLDYYHADGLRVDAVSSMLYLDYARKAGEWIPNQFGGKENLDAISFLQTLNQAVYGAFPDVQLIAEESTAWPSVSRPVYLGGLGFGLKWNMGWMHDTLEYMSKDPVHRKYHQGSLTFSLLYAFHENFVLSLSHDEVVYGKRSLLSKMPGDDWQRLANLRLLLGYMYAHPGKKLLFMGGEFGQYNEWSHEHSLDWHLLKFKPHRQLQQYVRELNAIYRSEPALYRVDFSPEGFSWINCNDWENSVISFLRKGCSPAETVIVACNFTPVPRFRYNLAAPSPGPWHEILNSDSREYGGSGIQNPPEIPTTAEPRFGLPYSLTVTLPPLGVIILKEGRNK